MSGEVAFVVPGALDQRTGGYLYDRHMVEGMRALGREVGVHELPGRFPDADDATHRFAATAPAAVRVVDGLALPAFADCVAELARPWVALVHHPLCLETGLAAEDAERLRALESGLLTQADRVLVTSRHTQGDVEALGIAPARIGVVAPGTRKPAAAPRAREAPPRRLLAVASLTARKGFPVLIEALGAVADQDWTLRIVGSAERDPTEARHVQRALEGAGIAPRTQLLGELEGAALDDAYRDADLFVLAPWHEGYGMVFAEALAHGLPVVGTSAGAVHDTVPPSAGVLVEPGDAQALADALREMFEDRALYDLLARGACSAGATLPDWPASVGQFANVLDRVMR